MGGWDKEMFEDLMQVRQHAVHAVLGCTSCARWAAPAGACRPAITHLLQSG